MDRPPEVVIADEGCDKRELVARAIRRAGAEAVMPPRSNRKAKRACDADRYQDRNSAERFGSKIGPFRRVATRHEETGRNVRAFARVASTTVLLR